VLGRPAASLNALQAIHQQRGPGLVHGQAEPCRVHFWVERRRQRRGSVGGPPAAASTVILLLAGCPAEVKFSRLHRSQGA
jgi:hypothetical protein